MQRAPRPQAARVTEADRETRRDFGDHLRAKGVSPKTLHIYVDAGESFAAFCADQRYARSLDCYPRAHRGVAQRGAGTV